MNKLQDAIDKYDDWMSVPKAVPEPTVAVLAEAARKWANPELIDIVFDGPPSHESGRFIEVENQDGQSVRVGEWIERDDGYWVLRLAILGKEGR